MNWSEEEYQAYLQGHQKKEVKNKPKEKKRSKFHNIRSWAFGLCFDSKKEVNYFGSLRLLHKAKEITGYLYHGKFVLVEGEGSNHRAVTYEPDFIILNTDGSYRIIDTKGVETPIFKDKMKRMREKYPGIKIELV